MFVSQERGAARKPFQKPNILRRKPKATKRNAEKNNEPSALSSINSDFGLASLPVVQAKELINQPLQITQVPSFKVISVSEVSVDQGAASQTLDINGDSLTIYAHDAQVYDSDIGTAQSTLNVESFLNDGAIKEKNMLFNIDDTSDIAETETKPKWCLDFGSEDSKDMITTSYYDGSHISNIYIDQIPIVCNNAENKSLIESSLSETNIILEDAEEPVQSNLGSVNTTVKFMCDMPNCKKSFWTEARLQMHKNVHNRPKKFPVLQCPVKKTDADGVETQCHRTFHIRNHLMKHLNDEHAPEDALYLCTKCGRRFYWACGARLHQVNGCARTFTCAWAGCGRVFRQQCRLREHARAHTGDRPYPCHYPGCGWSFRSASKLMRHARRHTGERRHACGACGRAFPRPEHLREHAARHHAPEDDSSPHLSCPHIGCERTYPTTSALYTHMKKFHKDVDTPQPPKRQKRAKKEMSLLLTPTQEIEAIAANTETIPDETSERMLVEPVTSIEMEGSAIELEGSAIELEGSAIKLEGSDIELAGSPIELEGSIEMGGSSIAVEGSAVAVEGVAVVDVDERCARTHCTWPLRPRDAHYALEEHAQVEQSESCESNIFTVRSDLFLHGNLLINEDSEFIISRAVPGAEDAGGEGEGAGEGALGLIDSHPTGDLTQEELMYADAVDESAFRVFLLNGEELA